MNAFMPVMDAPGDSRYAQAPARRAQRRRLDRGLLLAEIGVVLALAACWPVQSDAASLPPGASTVIAPPANVLTEAGHFRGSVVPPQLGHLESLACPPAGACVAVGDYIDSSHSEQAMVASGVGNEWGQASEIPPPNTSYHSARLDSVACPAAGSCVAIGQTANSAAMAVEQVHGVWGQAVEIPGVELFSVACSAPRSCVALGQPINGDTKLVGLVESEGVWRKPQPIALPANDASEYVIWLSAVRCQTSGPCVAVGEYTDTAHSDESMGLFESGGSWAPASEIQTSLNATGEAHLYSVACATAGPCTAVGVAFNSSGQLPISATESDAAWSSASAIPLLPALDGPTNLLAAIACPPFGPCAAVGYDESSPQDDKAIEASGAGGTWQPAGAVAEPLNAGRNPGAQLRNVACPASSSCLAIGSYIDSSQRGQAMVAAESDGQWTRANEVTAPPSALNGELGYATELELVACRAEGLCTAIGQYSDSAGTHMMAAGLAPTGIVSLASSTIRLTRSHAAAVRLSCSGTTRCVGSLTLTATGSHRGRKSHTIARAGFVLAGGGTMPVTTRVNAVGRRLVKRAHRCLPATIVADESSPVPYRTTYTVRMCPRY